MLSTLQDWPPDFSLNFILNIKLLKMHLYGLYSSNQLPFWCSKNPSIEMMISV